jgi:hypothetical protein
MLRAAMAYKSSLLAAVVFSCMIAVAAGCAPRLGDGCKVSSDCSVNGDRACDIAEPGGYCTIVDCSPGGCGDEGYCVRFRPDQPRLSRNYCMAKCSNNRDCNRDAYACRSSRQLNDQNGNGQVGVEPGEKVDTPIERADQNEQQDRIAEIIDDKENGKFCVVREESTALPIDVDTDVDAGADAGALAGD